MFGVLIKFGRADGRTDGSEELPPAVLLVHNGPVIYVVECHCIETASGIGIVVDESAG